MIINERFVRNICTSLLDDKIIFQKMVLLESLSFFSFVFFCFSLFFTFSSFHCQSSSPLKSRRVLLYALILRPFSSDVHPLTPFLPHRLKQSIMLHLNSVDSKVVRTELSLYGLTHCHIQGC